MPAARLDSGHQPPPPSLPTGRAETRPVDMATAEMATAETATAEMATAETATAEMATAETATAEMVAGQMDNRLVRPEEFFRLLTSRQKLERRDDQQRGLRGLLDAESGIRWLVDENDVRDTYGRCLLR